MPVDTDVINDARIQLDSASRLLRMLVKIRRQNASTPDWEKKLISEALANIHAAEARINV